MLGNVFSFHDDDGLRLTWTVYYIAYHYHNFLIFSITPSIAHRPVFKMATDISITTTYRIPIHGKDGKPWTTEDVNTITHDTKISTIHRSIEENSTQTDNKPFLAQPNINDEPNRVKFAYWVPNVSGGLVISKIPQRTQ